MPTTAQATRAVLLTGLAALTLTGCTTPQPPAPAPTPTIEQPTPTPTDSTDNGGTADPDGESVDPRIGQPANDGTFEPLQIPDGLPYGDDAVYTDEDLDNGMLTPGQPGIIYAPNASTSSDYKPTVLFSLDHISQPLTGADYDTVYDTFGLGNGLATHGAPIQTVTYRIREIATGGGDPTTFDIAAIFQALTFAGDNSKFLVSESPVVDCTGLRNPLVEHGWATGDTVQGCGFVITPATANQPQAMFYALQARGKLTDGQTDKFTIFQTDVFPDDGGVGHDDDLE